MVFFVNVSKYPDSYEKVLTKILFGIATDRFYEPGFPTEKLKTGFNKKGNKQYIYKSGYIFILTKLERPYTVPNFCTVSEYKFGSGILHNLKKPVKFCWNISDTIYMVTEMGDNVVVIYDDTTFNIKKPFNLIEDLKNDRFADFIVEPYIYTGCRNIYEYMYKFIMDLYPKAKKLTFNPKSIPPIYLKVSGDSKKVSGVCYLSGVSLFGKIISAGFQGQKIYFNSYCNHTKEFYERWSKGQFYKLKYEYADKSYSDILTGFTAVDALQKIIEPEYVLNETIEIKSVYEFLNHIHSNVKKSGFIFIYT